MYKLVAGRGKIGYQNWGVSKRDLKTLKKELAALKKYFGKEIILAGGGGYGPGTATLINAEITTSRRVWAMPGLNAGTDEPVLQAHLINVNPPVGGMKTFDPFIDSWQIIVEMKPRMKSRRR